MIKKVVILPFIVLFSFSLAILVSLLSVETSALLKNNRSLRLKKQIYTHFEKNTVAVVSDDTLRYCVTE